MTSKPAAKYVGRRGFLGRAGVAVSAAAAAPLLTAAPSGATTTPSSGTQTSGSSTQVRHPDELFRTGRFDEADDAYQRVLDQNPNNAHCLAQRGYIALLANRFEAAEQFLTKTIDRAPDDGASKQRLAECFVRQDDFARAVPLLRASGQKRQWPPDDARATWYAGVTGKPYQVHGAETTRLPFLAMDPLPVIEVSVSGLPPQRVMLDTGAPTLGISSEAAANAGVREVTSVEASHAGTPFTMHLGVVDSVRLGDIELHNVPITWNDSNASRFPRYAEDPQPSGILGTAILYHFLSTMDYASGALVLRQKTSEQLDAFNEEAESVGAEAMPFWMASDHFLFARGSLNGHGPMLFAMDTGGPERGVETTQEMAAQVGFEPEYSKEPRRGYFGGDVYTFTADEVALGDVVRYGVRGHASPSSGLSIASSINAGFQNDGNVTHEFFKPLSVTWDFVNMTMYLAGK